LNNKVICFNNNLLSFELTLDREYEIKLHHLQTHVLIYNDLGIQKWYRLNENVKYII